MFILSNLSDKIYEIIIYTSNWYTHYNRRLYYYYICKYAYTIDVLWLIQRLIIMSLAYTTCSAT